MTLPVVDLNGEAAAAAAEGKFALADGDTPLAHDKYGRAGQLLERECESARRSSERQLLRFLAASQYYHGGDYARALKLGQRVERRLLPVEVQRLHGPFLRNAKQRAAKEYAREVRDTLLKLLTTGRPAEALELVNDHPYVLDAPGLAFLRAVLCEELKQYRAAALFYARAIQLRPDEPGLLLMAAGLPLVLSQHGRLDEAWEYAQYQRELLPNALTAMTAAVVCFQRSAVVPDGPDRRAILQELIRHFEIAWGELLRSPALVQHDRDVRELMDLCFEATVLALNHLGQAGRATQVRTLAAEFNPRSALAREARLGRHQGFAECHNGGTQGSPIVEPQREPGTDSQRDGPTPDYSATVASVLDRAPSTSTSRRMKSVREALQPVGV